MDGEQARALVVFAHLVGLMGAAGGVALVHTAVMAGPQPDLALLQKASRAVVAAFVGLWVTGLLLIGLDTGFDAAAMASRDKLLAKLTVLAVLTANSVLLHRMVFPCFVAARSGQAVPRCTPWLASAAGAVSAAGWLYAVFLGVARAFTPVLGYRGFMAGFALTLALALAAAAAVGPARVRERLALAG